MRSDIGALWALAISVGALAVTRTVALLACSCLDTSGLNSAPDALTPKLAVGAEWVPKA